MQRDYCVRIKAWFASRPRKIMRTTPAECAHCVQTFSNRLGVTTGPPVATHKLTTGRQTDPVVTASVKSPLPRR